MATFYMTPSYRQAVRWYRPVGFNGGTRLPVDVRADEEAYTITAAVPGLKAEDLHVEVLDDVVTLRGQIGAEDEAERQYLLRELSLGEFSRSLRLPDPLDASKAEATVVNGMLTLRIPKADEARPKVIQVKAH